MIQLIVTVILIVIAIYIILYGAIFLVAAMAYGYWGFSIGMAPVLWLLMLIGATVGFAGAVKNAFRAIRALKV